jgi:hypothetical protein
LRARKTDLRFKLEEEVEKASAEVALAAEDATSAPAETVTVCTTVRIWTLVAMLVTVTVIAAVGQTETGGVLFR